MKLFRKYIINRTEIRLFIRRLLHRGLLEKLLLCIFLNLCMNALHAQRVDVSLDKEWYTRASDTLQSGYEAFGSKAFDKKDIWKRVDVPHNWDEYNGYRRLRHGNRHGYAYYVKYF